MKNFLENFFMPEAMIASIGGIIGIFLLAAWAGWLPSIIGNFSYATGTYGTSGASIGAGIAPCFWAVVIGFFAGRGGIRPLLWFMGKWPSAPWFFVAGIVGGTLAIPVIVLYIFMAAFKSWWREL